MFGSIARFELRYQFRNPVFWVVSVIFFLLTFGAMTVENIQIGAGGNVLLNSPQAIVQTLLIMTVFFMFVTTAFVANVVVRDDESGFGPMVRSTQVSKFAYLIGRFSGAFGAAAIAFLTVPLGMLLGSFMPWLDPETLGPLQLSHYAFAYGVMALPGILLTAALFFAVACITRSMMQSYIAVVAFLVLYFVVLGIADSKPELRDIIAIAEPFGLGAFGEATRYWSPAESNTQLPALSGALLANRLLVIGVSLLALALAYQRFSFSERGLSGRQLKKQQKQAERLAREQPQLLDVLPAPRPHDAALARLMQQAELEMGLIFRSPSFFVLMVFGLVNAFGALFFANELYGTPARALTFAMVGPLSGSFGIVPVIIAIFYAGELVWRDRDRGMHEIIDATSLPNWAYLLPKLLGVFTVLIAALLASVIGASVIQLARGATPELGKWLAWYLLPLSVDMLQLAVLAVLFQALSPSKYIGWGLMVIYLVATLSLYSAGFQHPLYLYGESGLPQLSDMNGSDAGGARAWALRLYWTAVAIVLAVIAHLLWRRGTAVSLRSRLASAPAALLGLPGMIGGAALLMAASTGGWLFYQMNVVNEYVTSDEEEARLAEFEKRFLQYETVRQPSLTTVTLDIDLYPSAERATFDGRYELVNDTGAPVEKLYVVFDRGPTRLTELEIPDAELELDALEDFGLRVYRLVTPLQPGDTSWLRFRAEREPQGFTTHGAATRLVSNGTFLNNGEFAPQLGISRGGLLQDRAKRRKYGLPAELRMPTLEDEAARERNYVGNVDWVMSDITVTTDADQVPVAPGERVSDETREGRRTVRFVSSAPILAFFSIQSARYDIARRNTDGVEMSVYHHPAHDFNVERMLDALEQALAYYQDAFGPYQFGYARIVEFPAYAQFAQAFAGTIPYSESLGFIANQADDEDIDFVTFVTAHEAAHQYWAHQLISADQQGGTLLVESLAEYSALMVMKQRYGEDAIRRFLKYDLDRYLGARGSEVVEELPLLRVENQPYIHYYKGGHVLYLLQARLGEDRVNGMLAGLLERYRFKGQPYANSLDLLAGFQALARDGREARLIEDSLEKITLYDLQATSATVTERPDGRFETRLTIEATKRYADGKGYESPATLDQLIEVGVFTERPGFGAFSEDNVLAREWRPVGDGVSELRIISDVRPAYAGIDPYNLYIDRNSDDNIIAVE